MPSTAGVRAYQIVVLKKHFAYEMCELFSVSSSSLFRFKWLSSNPIHFKIMMPIIFSLNYASFSFQKSIRCLGDQLWSSLFYCLIKSPPHMGLLYATYYCIVIDMEYPGNQLFGVSFEVIDHLILSLEVPIQEGSVSSPF